MRRWRRTLIVAVAGLLMAVTGCADSNTSPTTLPTSLSSTPASPSASAHDVIIIDVRTPQEFSTGHLDGAINIDLSASDFTERITALDASATYVVYCRSGNRSAQAVTAMKGLGFTEITDAGGLQDAASSTGREIVTT